MLDITTGESRLITAFSRARERGRTALVTYLMAGYPDLPMTQQLVRTVADAGTDVIELGVPFSDPIADGPAIQRAAYHALQQGVTPADCLQLVQEVRRAGVAVPLVLMGYYNPIYRCGAEAYVQACVEAGVDGLIVPDLPLEEANTLATACHAHGLALIGLVAPNTPTARAASIAERSTGFLYLVSRPGTTGARAELPQGLAAYITAVRAVCRLPLALGFGISTEEQVRTVAPMVDGVVVGSALVERAAQGCEAVGELVAALHQAAMDRC